MSKAAIIEAVVRGVNGGCFANVDYTTKESRLRKSATDGSGDVNPLWNRKDDLQKVVTGMLVNLGVVYGRAVVNRVVGAGGDPDAFRVEAMSGKQEHAIPHKNLCQNMDRSKTYLRYMPCSTSKKTVTYLLDGKDVGAELARFIASPAPSKKQQDAGLSAGETIAWNTLDINNIDKLTVLGVTVG